MALYFKSTNPGELLEAFKTAIDKKSVATWSYDSDGDFTHTAEQWKNRAWFKPSIQTTKLALFILAPKGKKMSSEVYAIYHGRFTETMLRHCDGLFTEAISTAMPDEGDIVGE